MLKYNKIQKERLKKQQVKISTSDGVSATIHEEDITTLVNPDYYQQSLPLNPRELAKNPLWNEYAVLDGLRLVFCSSDGTSSAKLICKICKKHVLIKNLGTHSRFFHRNVHPHNLEVQLIFELNYFASSPYMRCRLCDKRMFLENRLHLETMRLVASSWGKEHIVIYHQKELETLINDKMNIVNVDNLFIDLSNKKLPKKLSDEEFYKKLSLLTPTFFDELEEGISECKTCKLLFLHDETLLDHLEKEHFPTEEKLEYFFSRPSGRCGICGTLRRNESTKKAELWHLISEHKEELESMLNFKNDKKELVSEDCNIPNVPNGKTLIVKKLIDASMESFYAYLLTYFTDHNEISECSLCHKLMVQDRKQKLDHVEFEHSNCIPKESILPDYYIPTFSVYVKCKFCGAEGKKNSLKPRLAHLFAYHKKELKESGYRGYIPISHKKT